MGTISVGDMNVHHKEWLRSSSGTPPEGRRLFQVRQELCIVQRVMGPTRGNHLSDLVLTDLGNEASTQVFPSISDHKVVFCRMRLSLPARPLATRQVY